MEKDIVDGQIGSVGGYDLEYKENEFRFIVKVGYGGMSAQSKLAISSDQFLDWLKGLIPGQVDDAIFDVIKAALKMKV